MMMKLFEVEEQFSIGKWIKLWISGEGIRAPEKLTVGIESNCNL